MFDILRKFLQIKLGNVLGFYIGDNQWREFCSEHMVLYVEYETPAHRKCTEITKGAQHGLRSDPISANGTRKASGLL